MSIAQKLGIFAGSIVAVVGMLFLAPLTSTVSAQSSDDAKQAVCAGLGAATGGSGCEDPAGSSSLNGTVTAAINIVSLVVAVIAIFMVIVGGLKYITSQGESSGTASAKNTIIYAIVGLVIVAMAQLIVRFVANRVTTPSSSQSTTTSTPVRNSTSTPVQ